MKKRILVLLAVALVMAAMALVIAVPSFAAQPRPGDPNTHQRADNSHNCIGVHNAQVVRNGPLVSEQDRQQEMISERGCNNANQR
jgi:hypothetical protein